MNQSVVRQRNDTALRQVIDDMTSVIGESLRSAIDQNMNVTPSDTVNCTDLATWQKTCENTKVVLRGSLEGEETERHLLLALDLVDAITLSGHMMLSSGDVIEADRASGALDREHYEALGEVGNILCSAISRVLRRAVGTDENLRIRDFGTVDSSSDSASVLGSGEALIYEFGLQIGDYPRSEAFLILDPATGHSWNQQTPPLSDAAPETKPAPETAPPTKDATTAPRVRTKIAAFVTSMDSASVIRECGLSLDLEVERYSKTDIPNPAAHPGEIVLIEIPLGEEKRFEWAKRLKQYRHDISVVLLLHQPSRPRVVQGLLTKSNVILAWPSNASQLRAKIEPLLHVDSSDKHPS